LGAYPLISAYIGAQKDQNLSKRTTITNSIRWLRFLWGFMALSCFIGALESSEGRSLNTLCFLIFTLLTFLFFIMRRVRFDENGLYRIYGKKEKFVPISDIVSIKRSAMKINSTRMWKVTYHDKDQLEHKIFFLEGTFRHGSTQEFIKLATSQKPSIVVWQHPFFNHPEEKGG
jgi:hypothetical protein